MREAQFERMQGIVAAWGGLMMIGAAGAGMLGYGVQAMIGGAILICTGIVLAFGARQKKAD